MQTTEGLLGVMHSIAEPGFNTGLYTQTSGAPGCNTWIGFAASKSYRRYFLVKQADAMEPRLSLLDHTESYKPIELVDATKNTKEISLYDLVKNGHDGILRGFGFYPLLAERGALRITDFSPVIMDKPRPSGTYRPFLFGILTLEKVTSIPTNRVYTKTAAFAAVETWTDPHDQYFAVVVDYVGDIVAVYYKGKRII